MHPLFRPRSVSMSRYLLMPDLLPSLHMSCEQKLFLSTEWELFEERPSLGGRGGSMEEQRSPSVQDGMTADGPACAGQGAGVSRDGVGCQQQPQTYVRPPVGQARPGDGLGRAGGVPGCSSLLPGRRGISGDWGAKTQQDQVVGSGGAEELGLTVLVRRFDFSAPLQRNTVVVRSPGNVVKVFVKVGAAGGIRGGMAM
jgi:hypothetical protein